MSKMRLTAALLAACAIAAGGCKNWKVSRTDPDKDINLTYRFNDADARIVFEELIGECMSAAWLTSWEDTHSGAAPIVFVGRVRNETEDYIDTQNFTKKMEQNFINSGRVRVVADQTQRDELRDERIGQQEFSRAETIKKVANELGADLAMIGRVGDDKQMNNTERKVVSYYQVNLELIDIETNEKLWIGTSEVKKTAKR